MDKRFLYLILIIVIVLVVILAWQDSKKQQSSIIDEINATPTPAIVLSPSFLSTGQPQQAGQSAVVATSPSPAASQPAIMTLDGGVKIQDFVVGTGKEVKSGDTIAVNYIGYLENGQKFDSSYDRNKPFIFQIGNGQVIQGWDIGIMGMKEGGQRRIYIPSNLAYGAQGTGNGTIPPNANLIFDVQLLSVE